MVPDWLRTFKNWIIFHTFRGSQAFLLIAPQLVSFLYIKTTLKIYIFMGCIHKFLIGLI